MIEHVISDFYYYIVIDYIPFVLKGFSLHLRASSLLENFLAILDAKDEILCD